MNTGEQNNIKSKIPAGNPFQLPEGYFDSFAGRLQEKISSEREPAYKSTVVWRVRLVPLLAAASFMLFIALGWLFWLNSRGSLKADTDQLSEIIEYTGVYYDEVQLADILDEETANPATEIDEKVQAIEYLSTEDIALEDIIEDL